MGFRYGDTPQGNPYLSLMVETLHQCDQGVLPHMIDCLKAKLTLSQVKLLDDRMTLIRKQFWIGRLRLPGPGFWTKGVNITGHEHRSVMQV